MGHSREEAREALHRAKGNVKLAVLLLHGCSGMQPTSWIAPAGSGARGHRQGAPIPATWAT